MKPPLYSAPAPDLSNPVGMLAACHQRVLEHCDLLQRLIPYIAKHGWNDDAEKAAKRIVRYFSLAGADHHEDEEQDLFPLLIRTGDETIITLITELKIQHRALEKIWARVQQLLTATKRPHASELQESSVTLIRLYQQHVKLENESLLPFAHTALGQQSLQQLEKGMRARRENN